MSRSAIKAINWAAIAERVPEEQKQLFFAFKAKSDQYLRRLVQKIVYYIIYFVIF